TFPRASKYGNVVVQHLGKTFPAAFLIICHFLIVTILIMVLTNSFVVVATNSQGEEDQLLVAVNTPSLVKSDSL
ncbi:hypothetical protein HOY80DRAFT_856647, partial [Tuber brumale]